MRATAPVALTIAGSDSSGGAGIQADLKTFAALGVYGASAITAITAQNTQRVSEVFELPPELVAAQIDAVVSDLDVAATKTGMLANAATVAVVAEKAKQHGLRLLVVDPVMVAKSGDQLLRQDAVDALRELLVPICTVLTPNLPEAEVLLGRHIATWEDVRAGARDLVAMGAQAVVMKGGHALPGADPNAPVTDLFFDGTDLHEFSTSRVQTTSTHGTGCTFASAIAAGLARGETPRGAVAMAKAYVTKALQSAYPIGHGHGPVHHFFRFWQPTSRPGTWDEQAL
ncbi:MAG: bifunctional hydroxymethylpyrimidine kinase/phosphomethylpyrimidine kinase [Dehalococcoidia bacterium]